MDQFQNENTMVEMKKQIANNEEAIKVLLMRNHELSEAVATMRMIDAQAYMYNRLFETLSGVRD